MKKCAKCNSDFLETKKSNFCSRSCANSRVWSEEDKNKKSISAKKSVKLAFALENLKKINFKEKITKVCKCGKSFLATASRDNKKYCNKSCALRFIKSGGCREKSGRGKSGYYKGIYCNSTYELQWVIYHMDHNIPVRRFKGYLSNGRRKYFPDFIDPNNNKKIIEIKGYYKNDLEEKNKLAISLGCEIEVLFKENLTYIFDYIKSRYNQKKIYELYDNYKPKYSYICNNCLNQFSTEKQKKTTIVYCTRKCAGLKTKN